MQTTAQKNEMVYYSSDTDVIMTVERCEILPFIAVEIPRVSSQQNQAKSLAELEETHVVMVLLGKTSA